MQAAVARVSAAAAPPVTMPAWAPVWRGDDLARSRLQFGDVDEGARGLPHGVERLRIHEAAAEARQQPRSVHPLRDGQTLVDIHEP